MNEKDEICFSFVYYCSFLAQGYQRRQFWDDRIPPKLT